MRVLWCDHFERPLVAKRVSHDSSNAMGNFCFEVSLSYRRAERLPRVTDGV